MLLLQRYLIASWKLFASGRRASTFKALKLPFTSGVGKNAWIEFLQGKNPTYPETAMQNDLALIQKRLAGIRADRTPPEKRLADNMLDLNPVAASSLIRLTQGGLEPGRDGGVLNARLRYFDPVRRRAGLPEDVAALISQMTDTTTTVTMVNTGKTARTLVVQGGAFAEHDIQSVDWNGKPFAVSAPSFTVKLDPGAGGMLTLRMKRYANKPTEKFPWDQ